MRWVLCDDRREENLSEAVEAVRPASVRVAGSRCMSPGVRARPMATAIEQELHLLRQQHARAAAPTPRGGKGGGFMLHQGRRAIALAPLPDDYFSRSNIYHEVVVRSVGDTRQRARVPRVASLLARAPPRLTIEGIIQDRQQHNPKQRCSPSAARCGHNPHSSAGVVAETAREPHQQDPPSLGLAAASVENAGSERRADAERADCAFLAEIDDVHHELLLRSGGTSGLDASIPHGGLTCGVLRDIGAAPQLQVPF